jgi:hypothetical protein
MNNLRPNRLSKSKLSPAHFTGGKRPGLPDDWDTVKGWATDQPPFYSFFTAETKENSVNSVPRETTAGQLLGRIPKATCPEGPQQK